MTGLLGLGVGVMILADAVVGMRLLALWWRTRRLPELGLGVSLLGLGAIGYPLSIAARRGLVGSPGSGSAWLGAGLGLQDLGCAAMAVATVAMFRSGVGWARALATVVVAILGGSWIAEAATGDFARPTGETGLYWIGLGARALPFLWCAAESWHYHGMLRRRLALGLADRVVTDRLRLWATSSTGVFAAFAVFASGLVSGVDVSSSPWVLGPTSLAGWISGVTLWLAFLPPGWYLRRLQAA